MQAEWITMFKEFESFDDIIDESAPGRNPVQTIATIAHCRGYTIIHCRYHNMPDELVELLGIDEVLESICNENRHATLRDAMAMIDHWYMEIQNRIEDLNRMDEDIRTRAIRVIDLNPCLYEHKAFILTEEWCTREHYLWIIGSPVDEILGWCEAGEPTAIAE
jgi:hypothetical protein